MKTANGFMELHNMTKRPTYSHNRSAVVFMVDIVIYPEITKYSLCKQQLLLYNGFRQEWSFQPTSHFFFPVKQVKFLKETPEGAMIMGNVFDEYAELKVKEAEKEFQEKKQRLLNC